MTDQAFEDDLVDDPEAAARAKTELSEAICSHGMLVNLSTSAWSPKQPDDAVASAAAASGGASGGALSARKNVLYKHDGAWRELMGTINHARTRHYELTLPWQDRGARLLPNDRWMAYTQDLAGARSAMRAAVKTFKDDFDADWTAAQKLLGTYADADKPSAEDIAARFDIRIRFEPIPAASAFRNLPPKIAEHLAQHHRDRLAASAEESMAAAGASLREHISTLVQHCDSENRRWRQSLLDHIAGCAATLRALTPVGGRAFADLADEVETRLGGWSMADAKENPSDAAKDARAVLDKMAALGF